MLNVRLKVDIDINFLDKKYVLKKGDIVLFDPSNNVGYHYIEGIHFDLNKVEFYLIN